MKLIRFGIIALSLLSVSFFSCQAFFTNSVFKDIPPEDLASKSVDQKVEMAAQLISGGSEEQIASLYDSLAEDLQIPEDISTMVVDSAAEAESLLVAADLSGAASGIGDVLGKIDEVTTIFQPEEGAPEQSAEEMVDSVMDVFFGSDPATQEENIQELITAAEIVAQVDQAGIEGVQITEAQYTTAAIGMVAAAVEEIGSADLSQVTDESSPGYAELEQAAEFLAMSGTDLESLGLPIDQSVLDSLGTTVP